jgi:hypothetical protein
MTTNATTILRTSAIDNIASVLGRYGLVIVIGWIGALKFANYEATADSATGGKQSLHGMGLPDFPRLYVLGAFRCVRGRSGVPAGHQAGGAETVDRGQPDGHRAVRIHDQLPVHHAWGR